MLWGFCSKNAFVLAAESVGPRAHCIECLGRYRCFVGRSNHIIWCLITTTCTSNKEPRSKDGHEYFQTQTHMCIVRV